MDSGESKQTRWLTCLALALATFGIYWRLFGFGFVSYDDGEYIIDNRMVRAGLTLKGVLWAFTHTYASNWHPLTWISLMLDCQIFGLHHPGGFHLVNVALHAANAVLLFLLLHRMTGAQWRSAIVAALFALHPMHVESVAWISERKDVLSTFFGLLTLLAYVRYTEEFKVQLAAPKHGEGGSSKFKAWHGLALLLFALGLLTKPMLVTLPFVILLLDFWPLQRVENAGWRTFFTPQFGKLVREKWAWFALCAASCAMTFYAQRSGGAVVSTRTFPLFWRMFATPESYCWYVRKTFWPTDLAIFYPLEHVRPLPLFIAACLFLMVVSAAVAWMIRRRPFLLMGWLWFVGTLVPVIGLVQVGGQGMADRYSYLPSIGLFIAVTWWIYEWVRSSKLKLALGSCAAVFVLVALSAATFIQVGYWRDSIALFGHAVQVTRDNDVALDDLGCALYQAHRYDEALARQELAVRLQPRVAAYQNDLGVTLAAMKRPADALAHYAEAAQLEPKSARYQNNLATALARAGQQDAAIEHYQIAIREDPKFAEPHSNLGALYVPKGRLDDAAREYSEALRLDLTNATMRLDAGLLFLKMGRADEAMNQFADAVRLSPDLADARYELGRLMLLRGEFEQAQAQLEQAVKLKPDFAFGHFYLGLACLKLDLEQQSLEQLQEAARLRPAWAEPLNAQAWILAASTNNTVRNGEKAVQLAEQAVKLSSRRRPEMLHTLGAAYAEAGLFDQAVATANEALAVAQRGGQSNLVARIQAAIELYNMRQPIRELPGAD